MPRWMDGWIDLRSARPRGEQRCDRRGSGRVRFGVKREGGIDRPAFVLDYVAMGILGAVWFGALCVLPSLVISKKFD